MKPAPSRSEAFLRRPVGNALLSEGSLPHNDEEALARINARLQSQGREPLTKDRVYIVPCEACNDSFVPDRYCFIGESSLRNLARYANEEGFPILNSHGGGWIGNNKLSYGAAFAGRYEAFMENGKSRKRTLLSFYMPRGFAPNGEQGPTTDDVFTGIETGVLSDVSPMFEQGKKVCDVCGNGLYAKDIEGNYLCRHYPGSGYNMTSSDRERQMQKGVPDGLCSYTLEDGVPGELSFCATGAVTGAGFSRVRFAVENNSEEDRLKALFLQGEPNMNEEQEKSFFKKMEERLSTAIAGLAEKFGQQPPPAPQPTADTSQELTALQAQTESLNKRILEMEAAERTSKIEALCQSGHIAPAAKETARTLLEKDPAAFEAFVKAQGTHSAFTAPTSTVDGATVATALSGDDADNAQLSTRAHQLSKEKGISFSQALVELTKKPTVVSQ